MFSLLVFCYSLESSFLCSMLRISLYVIFIISSLLVLRLLCLMLMSLCFLVALSPPCQVRISVLYFLFFFLKVCVSCECILLCFLVSVTPHSRGTGTQHKFEKMAPPWSPKPYTEKTNFLMNGGLFLLHWNKEAQG